VSFFGVLVNPWAPMRSDAAFCSLGRATINLLARRQPPFHSRDGRANQPHAARCEGSRPAPGSVCRLLSRTRHRLPCSVPGGLLVVIQRLRRAGAAALAARIDDDCAIAIRYRFCLSARGHRPGPAVRPTAIVSGTPFSLITSPQPKAPAITTSDARTKAALNEPVLSTIQPVTTGPMIPAMLARQF